MEDSNQFAVRQETMQLATSPADADSNAAPQFMSAIQYASYGGPDVLTSVMTNTPKSTAGKPLIRVFAASINPIDYRLRKGEMRWLLPGNFPRIPGFDVAGEIQNDDPSSGLKRGDRVMAFLTNPYGGGLAEYATCFASGIAKIPASMSFEQAAAIPLAGSTALQSLKYHGKLQSGDRVLINGASGGVGAFAVQIATALGAHVTAVASGKQEEFVRSLGAEAFIDYNQTSFVAYGETWDLIFDVAGKSSYLEARKALSKKGRFVSTEPSLSGILMSMATYLLPQRGRVMLARPCREDLEALCEFFEHGNLKITIDRLLDLDDAAQAHRLLEAGVERGKIVLRVGGESPHPPH